VSRTRGSTNVGDVRQQVGDDVQQRPEEHHRVHDGEVLAADGLDHVGPEARDAEERLEHDGAEERVRQQRADVRQHRQPRVAQHVAEQHDGL
jgi:hypothetical protein